MQCVRVGHSDQPREGVKREPCREHVAADARLARVARARAGEVLDRGGTRSGHHDDAAPVREGCTVVARSRSGSSALRGGLMLPRRTVQLSERQHLGPGARLGQRVIPQRGTEGNGDGAVRAKRIREGVADAAESAEGRQWKRRLAER